MKLNAMGRGALGSVRSHPWRVVAVAVPVVAASVITSTTMASARPAPYLAVSHTALQAAPSGHVLPFADSTANQRVVKGHSASVSVPWNVDGCDHDYGTANQCVPWSIPGATSQAKCTWLAGNGFVDLVLAGKNRQDLPENAQGEVCAS